ncbi:MAG: phosphoribosylformylglycinamidine synthase I [Anaerolineae bacterium]|nr:phosphoribosylformylglycinamidine synthase I [Anaerolineae bacterium]
MKKPKVLILLATGTNRDADLAAAFQLAGAETEIVPLNILKNGQINWNDYQMLGLPGGFSYADALGAGKLLAVDIKSYFDDQIQAFIASGKAVIGICNGFQTLVKSGILPGQFLNQSTLTFNQGGHFECRWTVMKPVSSTCVWTRGLESLIECPIAHGEGNFQVTDSAILDELIQKDQIALTYSDLSGNPANGAYPTNPNGSLVDIAGICNPQGNVLGLMPHPENHIGPYQHPQWTRGISRFSGLPLFQNGVKYTSSR